MKWIILGFVVILILNGILVSYISYEHGSMDGYAYGYGKGCIEPEGEIGINDLNVSYELSYEDCKASCSDSECMGFCLNMGELKEGDEKCLYNDDGSERICFGKNLFIEIGEVRRIE